MRHTRRRREPPPHAQPQTRLGSRARAHHPVRTARRSSREAYPNRESRQRQNERCPRCSSRREAWARGRRHPNQLGLRPGTEIFFLALQVLFDNRRAINSGHGGDRGIGVELLLDLILRGSDIVLDIHGHRRPKINSRKIGSRRAEHVDGLEHHRHLGNLLDNLTNSAVSVTSSASPFCSSCPSTSWG